MKMDKKRALQKIAEEIAKCAKCRVNKIGMAVPGEGNADADIVFIGEAPGKKEAETGKPFVGRSGKFLRSAMKDICLDEKTVFITSPVKYLPKEGTPSEDEIMHGRIHTMKQLDIIKPKLAVLMGRVACLAMLGKKCPINDHHGRLIKSAGRIYFVTCHPSAAMRFSRQKTHFIEDFKKLGNLARDRRWK